MIVPSFSLLHPWILVDSSYQPDANFTGEWVIVTAVKREDNDAEDDLYVTTARAVKVHSNGPSLAWLDCFGALLNVVAFMPYPDPFYPAG